MWLSSADRIWRERRTPKSASRFPSLMDRLDYNGLLAVQGSSARYSVLYNATGTNSVACVIDSLSLPAFNVRRASVRPRGFVADVKTWYFSTEDAMEAYYLSSMLNSTVINERIKPFQPKGLFGARAIHRRPFLCPIPKFDCNNENHADLARLSWRCHREVEEVELRPKGNVRSGLRMRLANEIRQIDLLVSKIIHPSAKE